ncbi:MAG TPA: hypothetical protein VGD53_03980 [Actinoallomurus sp.]
MPAGAEGLAILVERADRALVVRSADSDGAVIGIAAALPPERLRTTVVVDVSAAGALHALDDRLLEQLRNRLYADAPPGSELRLVAARAGRPDRSGAAPLAARLADRLGVGVVAPDGDLMALRGGELFSTGAGAGWLGFRRGRHPEWTGPRYPAPAWQAELPREFRTLKPRPLSRLRSRARARGPFAVPVTVTAIPAGLWVRRADAAPLPLLDLGFGVPVEAARPIVLVGAPGERVPHLNELVTFFEVLSPVIRESAVLVPYGQDPDACAALAQSLADRLGIVVRAYHALPHYTTDGTRGFAVWGEEGRPERLTDTPERVYVRASAGPAHRKTGVRERGLMDAATKAMFIHRVPRKAFAAEVPDAGDRPEDFDDLDPVAFEVPVAPSMWPTAAPVAGETPVTAGVVSVDAWGVMRPAGPWPGTAPRPGASPRLATQDREPVASVSADARPGASVIATLFPTTASTVLPQTRSATRTVGMPVKAGHPGTPAAAPYVWEAVGSAGAPPVPSPVGPLAPATEQERTEPPRRTPHEIVPPARPRPDVPDRVPAEPHRVAGNPLEWPEVRSAATAHDRDHLESAVLPDAAISRAEALPEVRTRVSQEAPVSEGPRTAPHSPDAAVPGAETAPDAVAAVPEAASRVAPDIGLSPGPAAAVPDALPEAPPVPADTAASPDAVPSVPPESRAPVASQRDYDRRWLAERMSTPEERHAFRTSLGWRYDAAVRSVARLLAEHPGLRGAATDDALMTELAAVWVFVSRDQAELVESIRGGGGEGNHALAVCAAAGLRRLPSLQGVVVRGGPRDASAADAYRTGEDLVEAAPLIACDDIGDPVPGAVEILIWSATARRLSGFVEDRAMPEVVFLPGTVFHVLAVDPPLASAAPGPRRVLLAEVPATKTGPGREKWIARVTARLKEAAANRPARSGGTDDRFAPLPGDPVRSMR